jgi:hypothetical protein
MGLLEFLKWTRKPIAGIVDYYIDPPEFLDGGLERSRYIRLFGDVKLQRQIVLLAGPFKLEILRFARGRDDYVAICKDLLSTGLIFEF